MTKLNRIQLSLPRWLAPFYVVIAVCLVPWILVLASTLPQRHLSSHWDLAWGGFDSGVLLAIIITAVLAYRRSWWVCLSAMSVCTLLVVDSWFDILTSRPGKPMLVAIAMALIVELPLAAVSFWLSFRVAKELVKAR